jgi:flavin-dependent dehydrogenase
MKYTPLSPELYEYLTRHGHNDDPILAELAAETADRALRAGTTDELRDYDRARHAATRDKFRLNRMLQFVIGRPRLADVVAHRLARRSDLADRLVGIAGDFVPARTAFDAGFLWDLVRG